MCIFLFVHYFAVRATRFFSPHPKMDTVFDFNHGWLPFSSGAK